MPRVDAEEREPLPPVLANAAEHRAIATNGEDEARIAAPG